MKPITFEALNNMSFPIEVVYSTRELEKILQQLTIDSDDDEVKKVMTDDRLKQKEKK